jgi:hypothetical protein
MRNYWMKIAAGALGIFAVGMLLITAYRSVGGRVKATLESTDPIPLPLAGLLPFNLDDRKIGSVDRVVVLRSDPERISGVRVVVKLADSASRDRLRACRLAIDDVPGLNNKTSFRCGTSGDTAGFEAFGTVVVKDLGDSFPLVIPAAMAAHVHATRFRFKNGEFSVQEPGDSIREALDAKADSLEGMADSLEGVVDSLAELEPGSSVTARLRRADSIRASVLRHVVEQLRQRSATVNDSDLTSIGDSIGISVKRALDSASRRSGPKARVH